MTAIQPETVMLPALVGIVRTLETRGLPMPALLDKAGLTAAQLRQLDVDARVPTSRLADLYEFAMVELRDPGLPIRIAQAQSEEDLGVFGFVIATATDGVTAIRRAARYARVAFDCGVDWSVTEHDDRIRVEFPMSPRGLAQRIQAEAGIASFLQYFRSMGHVDVVPNEVVFSHPEPTDTSAHAAFFRCPIRWSSGHAAFEFERHWAENALTPKADAKMSEFFQRYTEELLTSLKSDRPLTEQVRAILERELVSGEVSSARVAKQMGMSERSLRRALQAEDVGFRDLVDDVRRERAKMLLRSRATTVSDVAYLIGFSDVSAFSRAFKRWTGTSPRDFRLHS